MQPTKVKRQIVCAHSCLEKGVLMNSGLWGSLPKEVLQLVFARLPVVAIKRLRCVSKEWKVNIDTPGSEFRKACEEASTKTFALVYMDPDDDDRLWARVFDKDSNRWHVFRINDEPWVQIIAADGGLVCFVSKARRREGVRGLCITVLNPLTQDRNELPISEHISGTQPTMVQLSVDRDSKQYKVIVVDSRARTDCFKGGKAYVYDSVTRKWSEAERSLDTVLGLSYEWHQDDEYCDEQTECSGPWAYDFAKKQLYELPVLFRKCHALTKDRLFVLHVVHRRAEKIPHEYPRVPHGKIPCLFYPVYCITEYQAQRHGTGWMWVQVNAHRCGPFERLPKGEHTMKLYANGGSLMVCLKNDEPSRSPYQYDFAWIYDMSTRKWRDLPALNEDELVCDVFDDMCELSWDTIT